MRLLVAAILRLCFPSWRFFDAAGALPELQIRRRGGDSTAEPWVVALGASPRPPRAWFFHPEGTQRLAAQSVVERFDRARGAGDEGNTEHRMTALLVQHLAESLVPRAWREAGDEGWEWRVVRVGDVGAVSASGATPPV